MEHSPVIDVYLEVGTKRIFASAVEWPGWSRAGRTEEDAVGRLADYGPRYAAMLGRSGIAIELPTDRSGFDVGDRVVGDATTDFGATSMPAPADRRPLDAADVEWLSRILRAVWAEFDRVVAAVAGITLQTGPRGGGRSLEKIVEHVVGAEEMYLNALGARAPNAGPDLAARWRDIRPLELAAVAARARGETPANPSQTKKFWPPPYFVRRAAWHALDHLWEIEDRVAPPR